MPVPNVSPPLDDQTVTYVLAAQRPFEDLRQAVGQVSGWLVLAALRTNDAVADHPALMRASCLLGDCLDDLPRLRPTALARPHHERLMRVAHAMDAAVRDAQTRALIRTDADIHRVSIAVKAAYADLAAATAALPGFQMVSFADACCARHNPV